jgi:glutamate 5-kinase
MAHLSELFALTDRGGPGRSRRTTSVCAASTCTRVRRYGACSTRVLPVVNENDTVADDEIRYGDNDRLAAPGVAPRGG